MNLHYTRIGARELRPLILLHGFLGCGADWQEIAEKLSARYCSILVDLPGHGRSTDEIWSGEYGLEETATALQDLIVELGLQHPVLIGYSLGGRVSLYAALRMQQRLSGLILEGASPGLAIEAERQERMTLDAQRAEKLSLTGIENFVEEWYEADLFASLRARPESLSEVKRQRSSGDASLLARALRNLSVGRQPSLWDRLDELTLPVLLVAGELDRKFAGINRDMADRMQDVQNKVVPGAGHNTHLEQPDSFLEVVGEFLEKAGRRRQR